MKAKSQYLADDFGNTELADAFYDQVQEFHSIPRFFPDKEIEELLLKQKAQEVAHIGTVIPRKKLTKFSPSGASKCDTELYRIANGLPVPELELSPYNRRWTRNGTAIHEATQRDLLYMEKLLDNPRFTVLRNEEGLPMWEKNLYKQQEITHKGQTFVLSGMADGMLLDNETGEKLIFEFKTKSTTVAAVGTYKMKGIQDNHILQGVTYSIMFCGDPLEDRDDTEIFMYESLAKDWWNKGTEARTDIRVFQHTITLADRLAVLDRFADIVAMTEEPSHDSCDNYFCSIKDKESV